MLTGHERSNGNESPNQSSDARVESNTVPVGRVVSSQPSGEVSSSPPNRRATGSSGRRTVNGNHLLNFQYNPIARPQHRAPPLRKPQKIKPYNKDLFLQANYKFVVLDSGNYTLDSMDPDKMLQWEDIICVKYSTPQAVQCPICLDSPLCPQITSCGHIFCFPCILQYLLMGEENHKAECWRKCPLCFVMISTKDLYTIYIENLKEHKVGDTLEFTLLTRRKDSFSLYEKNMEANAKTSDSFLKFILTSDVDLSVREAMSDLDTWLVRADSGLVDDLEKLPYVCAAMEQLEQRKNHWNAHKIIEAKESRKSGVCHKNVDMELEGPTSAQSSDIDELRECQDVSSEPMERDCYKFYQAIDGQHIILHPLNMKCLLHHYGSYELLPARLSGKILQLESLTQNEAIRKRYRYLSHFPLTTSFQLCEINLEEILPSDALSPFLNEIKKREKQRKLLAKKEHEDKLKADAIGAYTEPVPYHIVQAAYDRPPTFSIGDFEALGSPIPAASSSQSPIPAASSSPVYGGRALFSNVARLGFAAGHDSPACIRETSSVPTTQRATPTDLRSQGACSFANVICRDQSSENQNIQKPNEVAGKKGKKQSRVLLSTSGGRRY